MTETIADAPSAEDLAWEAARCGLTVLDPEHRQWFEDAATFVAEHWPVDDGQPDDELTDTQARLAAAETMIEAIEQALGFGHEELDLEHVEKQIAERLERERQEGTKDATIPSRANTAQRKALRLLVDGKIAVQRLETDGQLAGLVVAECKGDSGETYTLGYDPRRAQWRCTCPELRGQCSHLTALKTIVAARPPR